ncbi:hypothetical protein EVAR_5578_1 [Eumeta japonica]|uniref:Uncharacterized protein n=1 Tax=Eumeta variegata TaxID=151549 RepID=A0A4C1U1N1_EUMVA|nr:hypothetical protein EVAR_5578_1 [Eumeta japonica]
MKRVVTVGYVTLVRVKSALGDHSSERDKINTLLLYSFNERYMRHHDASVAFSIDMNMRSLDANANNSLRKANVPEASWLITALVTTVVISPRPHWAGVDG